MSKEEIVVEEIKAEAKVKQKVIDLKIEKIKTKNYQWIMAIVLTVGSFLLLFAMLIRQGY